jgi:hypothetical protein
LADVAGAIAGGIGNEIASEMAIAASLPCGQRSFCVKSTALA